MKRMNRDEEDLMFLLSDEIADRYPEHYRSVRYFAKKSGVDEKTIRQILNCKVKPNIITLSRIAVALKFKNVTQLLNEVAPLPKD